jgi:hypothetical protein
MMPTPWPGFRPSLMKAWQRKSSIAHYSIFFTFWISVADPDIKFRSTAQCHSFFILFFIHSISPPTFEARLNNKLATPNPTLSNAVSLSNPDPAF